MQYTFGQDLNTWSLRHIIKHSKEINLETERLFLDSTGVSLEDIAVAILVYNLYLRNELNENFVPTLAKRFIAGYNFKSAKPRINKLLEDGYEVSIDYVGELSKTVMDCDKAKLQYNRNNKLLPQRKIDISIKPSQLGLKIDYNLCYMYLSYLAKMAKLRGHTIQVDMEDSSVTSMTINLAARLNKRFGNVGVAIQANYIEPTKI